MTIYNYKNYFLTSQSLIQIFDRWFKLDYKFGNWVIYVGKDKNIEGQNYRNISKKSTKFRY